MQEGMMATYVPAMRANMGNLEYYVGVVTLGEAARMVDYVEKVDQWTSQTPPELKLQRRLNLQRVEREMVPYLLGNRDHFYSALTVEIRPAPTDAGPGTLSFDAKQTYPGGIAFGTLTLDGTEHLYALDGQHRLKSIQLSIHQNPQLAREHITLILVPFQNVERSQTLFSDLNRYARSPSKSIALLFTHREPLARVTKELADSVPLLRNRVNMESTSLSSNAHHFITLSTLYEMTRALAGEQKGGSDTNEKELLSDLVGTWSVLANVVPAWHLVVTEQEHPAYLRQRYLSMHGVAQQAIAVATSRARIQLGPKWSDAAQRWQEIDWGLANPVWQGIALHGGRVNNTSTSIRLLANFLLNAMDLPAEVPSAQPPSIA